ncbi:MAG: hypothetical protein JXX14_12530 [Deltaproteobacteria bacterium]|nr:hypothetical protein [Deltaproteobacteria bacterium]
MNTDAIVYDQMMQEITSIPPHKTLSPSMPMDAYIQEALLLHHWTQADHDALLKAGLSETLLVDLPYRANAAREAQTIWRNFLEGQSEAQQRWRIETAEAYELRDELIHVMKYAYREEANAMSKLMQICDYDKNFDLVSDLHELASLGRENLSPLRNVGFNLARLEQAAVLSHGMRQLMDAAAGTDTLVKTVRDQAYTYLKEAVDAIRECGLCVFWQNPERRKGYESNTLRRKEYSRNDVTQPYVATKSLGK